MAVREPINEESPVLISPRTINKQNVEIPALNSTFSRNTSYAK